MVIRGITLGTLAGACWGLIYLLPLYLPLFSAVEITLGRYIAYGLLSLAMWFTQPRKNIPFTAWKMAAVFALTGNILFYALCVMGIQMLGASLVALLYAAVPVIVSIYGNYLEKEFPVSILTTPLMIICLGVIVIHLHELSVDNSLSLYNTTVGLTATILCVLSWSWYGVHNSKFLKGQDAVSGTTLTNMVGICCLAIALVFSLLLALLTPGELYIFSASSGEISTFVIVSLLLGVAGTWMATFFWNGASKRLPVALAGQLIATEVIFGLIYIYVMERRSPNPLEMFGILMVMSGVSLSLYKIQRWKNQQLLAD